VALAARPPDPAVVPGPVLRRVSSQDGSGPPDPGSVDRSLAREALKVNTPRTVLVTGVTRRLGAEVAALLAAETRVIGVDTAAPPGHLAGLLADVHLVTVDIRTPAIAKIIMAEHVEAVVHLAISGANDAASGGRAVMKELNVIGTMQLLAACQQAPQLAKLVVRSSTAAYGASFRDPAVFTEETEPREVPRGGFAKDVLDVEGYVRGFRRRRPDVAATVLRFAPFLGRTADTSLTRYFAMPVVPTVFGRDPRLQFLHTDDAIEVIRRAVLEEHPGTYNVAGAGVLNLSQAIRRAGRVALPILEPGLSGIANIAGLHLLDFTFDQLDLLVHGRVVDIGRLVKEFGFEPRSTAAAFDDFLRGAGLGPPLGERTVGTVEQELRRRLRAADRRGAPQGGGHGD